MIKKDLICMTAGRIMKCHMKVQGSLIESVMFNSHYCTSLFLKESGGIA